MGGVAQLTPESSASDSWDFTVLRQAWSWGTEATIPSLRGPTLTALLIPSVDPKLQDCVEGKGRGRECPKPG